MKQGRHAPPEDAGVRQSSHAHDVGLATEPVLRARARAFVVACQGCGRALTVRSCARTPRGRDRHRSLISG